MNLIFNWIRGWLLLIDARPVSGELTGSIEVLEEVRIWILVLAMDPMVIQISSWLLLAGRAELAVMEVLPSGRKQSTQRVQLKLPE